MYSLNYENKHKQDVTANPQTHGFLTVNPAVYFEGELTNINRNKQFMFQRSKLVIYIPFNGQDYIGPGPQYCHFFGISVLEMGGCGFVNIFGTLNT